MENELLTLLTITAPHVAMTVLVCFGCFMFHKVTMALLNNYLLKQRLRRPAERLFRALSGVSRNVAPGGSGDYDCNIEDLVEQATEWVRVRQEKTPVYDPVVSGLASVINPKDQGHTTILANQEEDALVSDNPLTLDDALKDQKFFQGTWARSGGMSHQLVK